MVRVILVCFTLKIMDKGEQLHHHRVSACLFSQQQPVFADSLPVADSVYAFPVQFKVTPGKLQE